MVLLKEGPADGRNVQAPSETWVWVAVENDTLYVFDLNHPHTEQALNLVGRGGWEEYEQDPQDPAVYRWSRRTP